MTPADTEARLQCYSCGASLEALSLPLSRRDLCPECSRDLHCCRMCESWDPNVPKQCREDDAEEVMDKEKANFCDWFIPAAGRYDGAGAGEHARAERKLSALFGGDGDSSGDDDDLTRAAEDLFRR